MSEEAPSLVALPLAIWERDGLLAALTKAGLPTDDVKSPGPLFWRFENDFTPVGFGGIEIENGHALLRSVVTLPPMRKRGIGRRIVAALETEARIRGCGVMWVLTPTTDLFDRIGYKRCQKSDVPQALQAKAPFTKLYPTSATAMSKRLD